MGLPSAMSCKSPMSRRAVAKKASIAPATASRAFGSPRPRFVSTACRGSNSTTSRATGSPRARFAASSSHRCSNCASSSGPGAPVAIQRVAGDEQPRRRSEQRSVGGKWMKPARTGRSVWETTQGIATVSALVEVPPELNTAGRSSWSHVIAVSASPPTDRPEEGEGWRPREESWPGERGFRRRASRLARVLALPLPGGSTTGSSDRGGVVASTASRQTGGQWSQRCGRPSM